MDRSFRSFWLALVLVYCLLVIGLCAARIVPVPSLQGPCLLVASVLTLGLLCYRLLFHVAGGGAECPRCGRRALRIRVRDSRYLRCADCGAKWFSSPREGILREANQPEDAAAFEPIDAGRWLGAPKVEPDEKTCGSLLKGHRRRARSLLGIFHDRSRPCAGPDTPSGPGPGPRAFETTSGFLLRLKKYREQVRGANRGKVPVAASPPPPPSLDDPWLDH